ncbi:MAG: hypothetical protein JSV51_06240 [Candidatus Bathyarchaeota archaeon]|nr:MAG: hypothetical protein JSV51_06240 [Candidatus Bathyarchaeota archaeon]
MKRIKKIRAILGVKGFLCLASLIMIALSLVTYTGTITMTPTIQFTTGATSDSWLVYINDVNETRHLPGGFSEPPLNMSDPNTFAFQVVTDANKVCAIRIELTSIINSSKFSNFNITAKYWNGTTWNNETLYDAATGSTMKPYIDGLILGDTAYLHQNISTTKYYSIEVVYSYDLVDVTDQISVTLQYTPLPQDSF